MMGEFNSDRFWFHSWCDPWHWEGICGLFVLNLLLMFFQLIKIKRWWCWSQSDQTTLWRNIWARWLCFFIERHQETIHTLTDTVVAVLSVCLISVLVWCSLVVRVRWKCCLRRVCRLICRSWNSALRFINIILSVMRVLVFVVLHNTFLFFSVLNSHIVQLMQNFFFCSVTIEGHITLVTAYKNSCLLFTVSVK